jgi:molecular chaperone GrpE
MVKKGKTTADTPPPGGPAEETAALAESSADELDALRQANAEQAARLDALQRELQDVQARVNEYLDGWQRERAEFQNYKKRMDSSREQLYQTTVGSVVRRYLVVVDDLERALARRPQDGDGAAWAGGVELIYRKLLQALEADGVQVIQADGQLFDPNLHEAIQQEPSPEHQSGQIIEVLQKGYTISGRVLRPATVRIAQ